MRYTVIKKNSYQDSVNLMLLTKKLSDMEGILKISVMMGTPANMDLFKNAGLYTKELDAASSNDICVVVESDTSEIIEEVMKEIEAFIKNQAVASKGDHVKTSRTWESALQKMPDANLALISIAGAYAAKEAHNALDHGLNVFIFSDNVTVEDEQILKEKAKEKGLLVMGPDCGTGIIGGMPLAFANVIGKGNIGIIGASGTGIQEVSTIIARGGGGITQAIGLGGRDLSEKIGGITAFQAIEVLKQDQDTEVVVFISKPPAKSVRDQVVIALQEIGKPVIAIFIGEKSSNVDGNIHYAWTLEDAAKKALNLSKKRFVRNIENIQKIKEHKSQRAIKGLYSGGTLAAECAMILCDQWNIPPSKEHDQGIMLHNGLHEIIDLGDDFYTNGKPHPMIDPTSRFELIKKVANEKDTAIILLDFVIGYGGNDDMAGVTAPIICEVKEALAKENRFIVFVASVTGTMEDPQNFQHQVDILTQAGVIVCDSNASAVRFCIDTINYLEQIEKTANPFCLENAMWQCPKIINIGLRQFSKPIVCYGGSVVNYIWHPVAGGNPYLASLVEKLKKR